MFSPHTVTLCNAVRSPSFDAPPVLYLTILEGVFLDDGFGRNTLNRKSGLNLSGIAAVEDAALFIPFACKAVNAVTGQTQSFVPPHAFELLDDPSGSWTAGVRGGASGADCFFLKGRVLYSELVDAELNFPAFCRKFEPVFRVTSVSVRDFGSPHLHHWKVGGCAGP